jgi:mRNA interferase MazF
MKQIDVLERLRVMSKNKRYIRRGDIYYANLTPVRGSEQGGVRPVVVIQNNIGNRHSPTLIVAVITSKEKPKLPTHVAIMDNCRFLRQSIVLLEQIRTIDKCRLGQYVASLNGAAMDKIDSALGVSVGLENKNYEEVAA